MTREEKLWAKLEVPVWFNSGVKRTITFPAFALINKSNVLMPSSFDVPVIRLTRKAANLARQRGEKVIPVTVTIKVRP